MWTIGYGILFWTLIGLSVVSLPGRDNQPPRVIASNEHWTISEPPTWSPDGQRIALEAQTNDTNGNGVHVFDVKSSEPQMAVQADFVGWTDDIHILLLIPDADAADKATLVNVDTSTGAARTLAQGLRLAGVPVLSTSRDWLAMVLLADPSDTESRLSMLNTETGVISLAADGSSVERMLGFTLDDGALIFEGYPEGIYAVDTLSGKVREIAQFVGIGYVHDLVLSPDGRTAALVDVVETGGDISRLRTVNLTTGRIRPLIDGFDTEYLVWSSDSRFLLSTFTSVSVIDVVTGNQCEIPDGANDNPEQWRTPSWLYEPTWSPTGGSFAFAAYNGGVRIVDTATLTNINISQSIDQDTYPAYSPDGTEIAYIAHWNTVYIAAVPVVPSGTSALEGCFLSKAPRTNRGGK
jgi:dipeptidyl aminopeptidase/acylaminoacyl peptidase